MPPTVVQIKGKLFLLAKWKRRYEGVLWQYREKATFSSAHLFVHPDGTWSIDHIDDYNPDMGYPVHHFFFDLLPALWGD